jgi:hypothetical protein
VKDDGIEMTKLKDELRRIKSEAGHLNDQLLETKRNALPAYWEQTMALSSDHGYALHEVNEGKDGETYKLLQCFLRTTKPHELGQGRDVKWPGKYTELELQRAWCIENPVLYKHFHTGRSKVGCEVKRVGKCNTYKAPSTNIELAALAKNMPGGVDAHSHEYYLLHGTKPDLLPALLNEGLNERYSSGLFGNGTYFAEDAAKIDQYMFPDPDPNKDFIALHKLLYPAGGAGAVALPAPNLSPNLPAGWFGGIFGSGAAFATAAAAAATAAAAAAATAAVAAAAASSSPPGTTSDPVFYCLLCRVALGLPVRTQDSKQNMDNTSRPVWAVENRELAYIETGGAVDPRVRHHSLLAEMGIKIHRFREIIVTHGEYIYPEYLLAYKRKP